MEKINDNIGKAWLVGFVLIIIISVILAIQDYNNIIPINKEEFCLTNCLHNYCYGSQLHNIACDDNQRLAIKSCFYQCYSEEIC